MEEKKNALTSAELNNNTIIKNFSYDQKEILYNIMKLHNDGKPYDCDITASTLKFYGGNETDKFFIPEPKHLFDVYPQFDRVQKITPFNKLPLEDKSINSIVIDLPFVISPHTCKSMVDPKEGSQIIASRFSSFYPVAELFENEYWWLKEAFRVLKEGGICVFKMQSTVSGGLEIWSTPFAFMCAQKLGFYVKDEFILGAKARLISAGKYKAQQHARKYTSTFWVFEKNEKKSKKTNLFNMLENCETQELEGKVWELK
jgi:hypothetical protein